MLKCCAGGLTRWLRLFEKLWRCSVKNFDVLERNIKHPGAQLCRALLATRQETPEHRSKQP